MAVAAFAVLGVVAAVPTVSGRAPLATAQEKPPPNVVVVMTDDQDAASVRVMEAVRRRIADRGTSFTTAYATTPLCCPSRASFLTGEYAHNHGVHDDGGGFDQFQDAATALPVELHDVGYRTGLIGKYLNGYDRDNEVPPGWDVWRAAVGRATTSYDYDLMTASGSLVHYGSAAADYRTDVYADKAVKFVRQSHDAGQPFFLVVTPGVPHEEAGEPPLPAPRHDGAFEHDPLPKPPSYNEEDVSDKPGFVRRKPLIGPARRATLREHHQGRLASLLAVDDLVKRLTSILSSTGEMEETVVVFTSDNGFMLGEHRLVRKLWLYEESARVPLFVRGPGFPPDERGQVVGNIDLAPTILDLADAPALGEVDGTSLLPLAADPTMEAERALLLENFSETRGGSQAVVTRRADGKSTYGKLMYAEHAGGGRELYDLAIDPFQLESRHRTDLYPEYADRQTELAGLLAVLRDCAGETCRTPTPGP
jgi:arylsulfatase A-like enzyme